MTKKPKSKPNVEEKPPMRKLYRSESNRKLGGVCGGIGELLEVDPTFVRLIIAISALATGIFPFVLGYLIAWWIIPSKSEIYPGVRATAAEADS